MAAGHNGSGIDHAGLLGQISVGKDVRGNLPTIDKPIVKPGGFAGRQHRVQHIKGGRIRTGGCRREPGQGHRRQGDIGAIARKDPRPDTRRLDCADPDYGRGGCLHGSKILVDPGLKLSFVEIARHDQGGVVGPVIGLMKRLHIVERCGIQFLDRTNTGALVGVGRIAGARHVERKQSAIGVSQNPLAQLFLDHIPFGLEIGLVDHQAGEPLGLHPDQPLEMVGRDHFIIVGEVVIG